MNGAAPRWPVYSEAEIKRVSSVLRSGKVNYWTGNECQSFEKEYAASLGVSHAIVVSNGTVALELALRALELEDGDQVIVSPRSFFATVSSIVAVGATPVFADVDSETGNISAREIRKVVTEKTRAVVTVHLGGWACDMDPILSLAKEFGLRVVEDCAQAHGAMYKGQAAGSIGDISAFSFCQDKIISTGGEGGMVVTNNERFWRLMWAYKDHGKDYETVFCKEHPPGFRWLHESFGSNFRMTEMQAAIGREQLSRLSEMVETRRRFASIIGKAISSIPCVRLPLVPKDYYHSYYRFYFYLRPERIRKDWGRDRVMAEISNLGFPCFSGSCSEMYLEKACRTYALQPMERLEISKELGETSVMFCVFPEYDDQYISALANAASAVLRSAST